MFPPKTKIGNGCFLYKTFVLWKGRRIYAGINVYLTMTNLIVVTDGMSSMWINVMQHFGRKNGNTTFSHTVHPINYFNRMKMIVLHYLYENTTMYWLIFPNYGMSTLSSCSQMKKQLKEMVPQRSYRGIPSTTDTHRPTHFRHPLFSTVHTYYVVYDLLTSVMATFVHTVG